MEFVFIVAIAAFFTAGMLYVVKSSDKKSKNNLKTAYIKIKDKNGRVKNL